MKLSKKLLILTLAVAMVFALSVTAFASTPTDEIENYEITVSVNDDGTLHMVYHFVWRVLESDGIGPVEWLNIGLANSHVENLTAVSDNIKSIQYVDSDDYGNYGSYAKIVFKESYYEGADIDFTFELTQDYMYELDSYSDMVKYSFTPGWFDGVETKSFKLSWKADKVDSKNFDGLNKSGYYVLETELSAGATYTFEFYYPQDAYDFDLNKYIDDGSKYEPFDPEPYDPTPSSGGGFAALFAGLVWVGMIIVIIKKIAGKNYDSGSGFASGSTKKKVTRTKVVYYDTCPGCGAARKEGKESCEYCGRSLIKSEEILSEETIKDEDKDALKYNKDGIFSYGNSGNTYVRVNVVHIPVTPTRSSSGGNHGGRSGGCAHSSCAHSSCACACASCACACACACAGGGRAGCTTKDFYNTRLKLKQLNLRKPLEK